MITVENLCKSYGSTRALKGISFEVGKGDVLGFLGPNGAGKSTAMKIVTGYLLPTSGSATVDGLDVVERSREVRRMIGYLPESTPLYQEMRVDEYLRFAASIRGVPARQLKPAVASVIDKCGLERVIRKTIVELSKGYRQRVGLAQAMVHDPKLLILDEPTSGLDPNQIVEVRTLIEQLGDEHTVILSTHYLQEVEASCSRIIVINLGEIVADDTAAGLIGRQPAGAVVARIKGDADAVQRQLGELLPERAIEVSGRNDEYVRYRIQVGQIPGAGVEDAISHLVVKNGWTLAELTREKPTLEQAFRALTVTGEEVAHA